MSIHKRTCDWFSNRQMVMNVSAAIGSMTLPRLSPAGVDTTEVIPPTASDSDTSGKCENVFNSSKVRSMYTNVNYYRKDCRHVGSNSNCGTSHNDIPTFDGVPKRAEFHLKSMDTTRLRVGLHDCAAIGMDCQGAELSGRQDAGDGENVGEKSDSGRKPDVETHSCRLLLRFVE